MTSGLSAFFPKVGEKFNAWAKSTHAKIFLAMALLTCFLTIAAAISVISGFRHSIESYSKDIALRTASGVAEEIRRIDPSLKYRRETAEILATWANPESVHQIDLLRASSADGEDYIEVWATSKNRPEEVQKDDFEIRKAMEAGEERAELLATLSGQPIWRIYIPIADSKTGKPKALLRAYCNLDRWNVVWDRTLSLTIKTIPLALLVEFALLWVLTSHLVSRPMRKRLDAMKLLGEGDISARANLRGQGELEQIARHFDDMAADLQKISHERETLLSEIKSFNATLQGRITAALSELQAKNDELERLIERISLLREELGQQERLAVVGQLTAAFAHEVGTPLNLVNGHIQMLIGELGSDSPQRERLDTILAQIGRVGEIVRKLLGLAKPMEIRRETVELKSLLSEMQRLWTPALAAHKVQFQARIPDGCSLNVDRKQLEQVFINLINNALDAMQNGGSITLQVAKVGPDGWGFALSDTGTGIQPDILNKVFKPMFTTKPEGKGTGLGLPICREIIRAHGGEISIESEEWGGTTVRFTLADSKGADRP
jgi:signal transduction histidine kinase